MTYRDPLHVPSAELVVWFKGKEALVLNKRLLDQQNCWQNIQLIKDLHLARLNLEDLMSSVQNPSVLMEQWTEVQFRLQDAWGFPRDSKFHRFWDIPACRCPKLDNSDAYPTGFYVTSADCPVHGFK